MAYEMKMPPKRRGKARFIIMLAVIAALLIFPALSRLGVDWLWYREMGRADVFLTLVGGRWLLGIGVGALFFAVVFTNVFLAMRRAPEMVWRSFSQQLREQSLAILDRALRRLAFWGAGMVSFFLALMVGGAAASRWSDFLLFFNAQRLGQQEPVFQRDIGFYLFRLPVWEMLANWLFVGLIFSLVLTGAVYLLTRPQSVQGLSRFSPAAVRHLSVLLALILVTKALMYYLGRFAAMHTTTGIFVGPGYTDIHARIPGLAIMAVIALLAAVVVLVNIWKRSLALPAAAVIGLIVASVLVLGIYPAIVQRARVEPNELALESKHLQNHINLTRQAFNLDKVREEQFSPTTRVTNADRAASDVTIDNIRLWDYRPLLQVYRQLQGLRPYYEIHDVDVGRYQIDGKMRQVMLSAREMNVNGLQGQQTWVNRHLVYTHGYGAIMSPVNTFDPSKGEPVFFLKNIPPESSVPEITVTRPEIYFGEGDSPYVIVRSKQQEFNYPSGSDNVYSSYEGTAGISLKNPFTRALLALQFQSFDLLVSDYITAESRFIFRRQIIERVQALAPFLSYDKDPYLVIGQDGKLYWMLDAYTHSARYPYAQHTELAVAGGRTVAASYLRNPAKVVVDAYNGDVHFYRMDEHEPLLKAWSAIFPELFEPASAMPAGLQQHLRVPEGYFSTLSEVYRRYHMTDPVIFYGQEDLWEIAEQSNLDTAGKSAVGAMEANYLIMTLPGEQQPEYLLIRPYTPSKRKNMIAWLSARNDPAHYGELLVYNFPKQSLVSGPLQIEANMDQDPEISPAFALWSQQRSRVLKGNLLVIPMNGTILYARPIYLQAEQSAIPQLQRVIVADKERVVMRRTLGEALDALTRGTAGASAASLPRTGPSTTPTASPPAGGGEQQSRARTALEHFQRADDALKRGDWAAYGKEIDAARHELEALAQ